MKFEIDKDLLKERIDELCTKLGMSRNAVFEKSGAGKNFISNLSSASASMNKLKMLANYLGTSVEYLIGLEDKESFARRVMNEVVEWLEDKDYTYEEQENSTVAIGKDGKYVYLTISDFENESLAIKEMARDGFELAMSEWAKLHFPDNHHNNNYLSNVINESDNAILFVSGDKHDFTRQELELVAIYRTLNIQKQAELIEYLLKLKK